MESAEVKESEENQSSVQNTKGFKDCLIHISSSEDDISTEVKKKQETQVDEEKILELPSESMVEGNDEFPEKESWWPHNDNSEWNLPKNKDNEKEERNYKKPDSDYYEDNNDTSDFEDENNNDMNYHCHKKMDDKETDYTTITFSRNSVYRDDPTDTFLSLHLGKVVKNKTYVVPKSCKPTFYINCTPKQYETASGNVFSKQSMVVEKKTHYSENEKWVFFKETTYCVNPLPPRKYNTYSYEINTECVFHVPVKIGSDVEFYFGTIRDPKNVSA